MLTRRLPAGVVLCVVCVFGARSANAEGLGNTGLTIEEPKPGQEVTVEKEKFTVIEASGKHSLPEGTSAHIFLVSRPGQYFLQKPAVQFVGDNWRQLNVSVGEDITYLYVVSVSAAGKNKIAAWADEKEKDRAFGTRV
jgi:hypothetical protein